MQHVQEENREALCDAVKRTSDRYSSQLVKAKAVEVCSK